MTHIAFWLLIISAHGYGGSPVVTTQKFPQESACKVAIVELKKHRFARGFASEPEYECVKLEYK